MHLLAYRPFIDPIELHDWWFLLLGPMALGVSIAYKAVRLHDATRYWKQVATMTLQIILGMIALGMGSYLFVQHVVPRIVP